MKHFKQTLVGLFLLLTLISSNVYAQDRIVIATVEGIEISYEIQFIGTDEKKNESKSRDEYQIVGYVTNKSGADLYTTSITPFRVEVNNAKGLTKAAKPTPQRTDYQTIAQGSDLGGTLYLLKDGVTFQDAAKVKVQKGLKPIINYEKTATIKPLDQWALQLNAATINGNWIFENSNTVVSFEFNAANNTIVQRNQGNTVVWYLSANNVYERVFVGVGVTGAQVAIDANATYAVTLTLVEGGRLMYRNTEGITVYLSRQ